MNIKRVLDYYIFKKSIKDMELDRILDKVSKKRELTNREIKFLDLYQITRDEDLKDFLYLSKNTTYKKVNELLDKSRIVICDLHDKNGKIGLPIISIENNFEEETCLIKMTKYETHKLYDSFLYNIIYNNKKNEYSLQEQDEYFEKIIIG